MKKLYKYLLATIVILMFVSVAFLVMKLMDKINQNSFLQSESESQEDQTYSHLSPFAGGKNKTIKSPALTTNGFDQLSSSYERECYNLIKKYANNISQEKQKNGLYAITPITISNCKLNVLQIKKVVYAIQNDNPDIFWISNSFSYQYSGNNTVLKLNSIFSKDDQQRALEKLNSKIDEIIEKIPFNASEYEIELFIHDYLTTNCKYQRTQTNGSDDPKIFTVYGCLIENTAVCEGYAKSMQLLLNSVGIKCVPVTGARGNEPHMWNIVEIDRKPYHVDVTWDATNNLQKYNYFNVNDEIIKKDHRINGQIITTGRFDETQKCNFKLPVCSSMDKNYYENNAVKINSLGESTDNLIIKHLINQAKKSQEFIYIMAKEKLNIETLKNYLFAQKPYKFFTFIKTANSHLASNKQISSKQAKYAQSNPQKTLIIQLIYN